MSEGRSTVSYLPCENESFMKILSLDTLMNCLWLKTRVPIQHMYNVQTGLHVNEKRALV